MRKALAAAAVFAAAALTACWGGCEPAITVTARGTFGAGKGAAAVPQSAFDISPDAHFGS